MVRPPDQFDLLLEPQFLTDSLCEQIINEAHSCPSTPARVYGQVSEGTVDERVRKANCIFPSDETVGFVIKRLRDYKERIGSHFRMALSDCEQPQFLRYEVGDFFVAHQDGNTGLIRLGSDAERKISIVIFLNQQTNDQRQGTYSGGVLRFSNYLADLEFDFQPTTGMLVAFRSELTHEVTQVTFGERYSIASWYR